MLLAYYMFKVIYGSDSGYLSALFYQRLHLEGIYALHLIGNLFSQGTIARHMCDEWNALPCGVREDEDFQKFKKKLKTFYFRNAFS